MYSPPHTPRSPLYPTLPSGHTMRPHDVARAEQPLHTAPAAVRRRPSRPSGQLILLEPVAEAAPMWPPVRPHEEAVLSPMHMWHRAPSDMPLYAYYSRPTSPAMVSPAMVSPTMMSPTMMSTMASTMASPASYPARSATRASRGSTESAFSVSSCGSERGHGSRLLRRTSSLGLRIKRSFARLRGRPSLGSL